MKKYSGPEQIYKELVEDSEESWLYGLVAFALVEEQKIEWMRHQELNTGSLPNEEEVKNWYEQQPSSVLVKAKGTAENALMAYSEEVVELVYEDHVKDIEDGIIVNEIRGLKSFWPQFGVNLAGGFVSALLFGILLAIIAFFVINDTSPVEIGAAVREQVED